MKKKLLSFIMSAILLAGLMPVNIQASEVDAKPLQTEATLSDASESDVVEIEEEILVEDTLEVETETVRINADNFPDENFRKYIKENFDANNDDVVDDIENITSINVWNRQIYSLKGIEHFGALETLVCVGNKLTSMDVSKNTALKGLYCNSNKLTSLDVSKNMALESLECDGNELTSLDVSKNMALKSLHCSSNNLTSLDVSKNTELKFLYCENNKLTSLDVSKNTALETLVCDDNELTSLDVSKNTALVFLSCYGNELISLDVSKNTALRLLFCDNSKLTSLDVSKNTALGRLSCDNNKLTSLDVSKNTALLYLHCDNNKLTNLDVSKNTELEFLNCDNNKLTSLDVSKNTALLYLHCDNNKLASLDVSKNTKLIELDIDSNITTDISVLNLKTLSLYVPQLKGTVDLSNITGIEEYILDSGWDADTKELTYDMETDGYNIDGSARYANMGKCLLMYVGKSISYQGYDFITDVNGDVRCYDSNDNIVINEFKCDGTYTYYFQADGTAVKNRYIHHPDGKHVIYFDENGHEVFSNTLVASYQGYNFITDANGNIRCNDSKGNPVINEFKCDGTYTYYFQLDGTAMRNRLTYHPDGKHVIYFDENGHEVFSNFHHVEKSIAGDAVDDLCFFDVYGYMYVDVMTYNQAGEKLYYVNPYGVIEQGKWFEFSDTCVWAGTTNKVGKGYGYANADGTLMINTYTYDWLGRYVYLQGNGHIQ